MQTENAVKDQYGRWENQQCVRIGAPPLRFKGCLVHWSEVTCRDKALSLGLFRKRRGGVVLALCRLTDSGDWAPHAICLPSVDDAMTAVEQYCCDLVDEVVRSRPAFSRPFAELSAAMARHGRITEEVHQFQMLAGQALDCWTRLCRPCAPANNEV